MEGSKLLDSRFASVLVVVCAHFTHHYPIHFISCLHILAKNGHISLVKHFFGEAGSSSVIFQKDRYGRTSVDEAEDNKFDRLADFLRRQAAASSEQDS